MKKIFVLLLLLAAACVPKKHESDIDKPCWKWVVTPGNEQKIADYVKGAVGGDNASEEQAFYHALELYGKETKCVFRKRDHGIKCVCD